MSKITYELKKAYPGLPTDWKEGMRISVREGGYWFKSDDSTLTQSFVDPKDVLHNDYWSKVEEEENEEVKKNIVLSYTERDRIFKLSEEKKGIYECADGSTIVEDHIRSIFPHPRIHSVKRLDDLVITLYDKFIVDGKDVNVVSFFREEDTVKAAFNINIAAVEINDLVKPTLLFTTYDGIDVYDEKQSLCSVNKYPLATQAILFTNARNGCAADRLLFFELREARKYIDTYSPKYSVFDIHKLLKSYNLTEEKTIEEIVKDISEVL